MYFTFLSDQLLNYKGTKFCIWFWKPRQSHMIDAILSWSDLFFNFKMPVALDIKLRSLVIMATHNSGISACINFVVKDTAVVGNILNF